jgi:thymidine phosphorylase
MSYVGEVVNTLADWLSDNPDGAMIPKAFVEKMLETNERWARQSEQKREREELVCRLLASGMPVDEISLILKIRKEDISLIEHENAQTKIPDYAKKLKARRKGREREAERQREMGEIIAKRQV